MRAVLTIAYCLSSHLALADEGEPAQVVYERVTILDLPEVSVDATVFRPDGVRISERRPQQFASMVVLRADFDDELAKSVAEVN